MRPPDHDRPHVVLVHRYFYPDTPPYATILRDIAVTLADAGLAVTVLTCQPSYHRAVACRAPGYEEMSPRLRIRRWPVLPDRSSWPAKVANLVSFVSRVVLTLARMRRVDVVMAASTPPVFVAMLVSVVARIRRFGFVYHKQDIYPEITAAQGSLAPPVRSLLRKLDAGTDRRATAVVVLSRDMADTVRARGARLDRIAVINNFDPWVLPPEPATLRSQQLRRRQDGTELRIVYAGNLGRFQNIPRIAEVMAYFDADPRVSFDIIGDGPLSPWLQRFAEVNALRDVRFHGYIAPDRLASMMRREFDVGIVSLHPGVIRNAYPSKMLSYLRNGLPVLALVETDSQLTQTLRRYGAGRSADPTKPAEVESVLEALLDDPAVLAAMGERARLMYDTEFSQVRQLRLWRDLFSDLITASARPFADAYR